MIRLKLNRRQFGLGLTVPVFLAGPVSPGSASDAEPGFSTEFVEFPSRGRQIRAVLFRPVRPLRNAGVVYLHGAGGVGPNQIAFAQRFATDGYLTLMPTYLDAAADDNVRPPAVMNAWRDSGIDAVEWLIGQGIDPDRTAVLGYSLGSYIAVDGALGDGRAAAAIGIAGGWDVYVPRPPARRIPVLIVRAEHDTHVSPAGTERWLRFLEERHVSVSARVVRGAGHVFREHQWSEVFSYASAFLRTRIAS